MSTWLNAARSIVTAMYALTLMASAATAEDSDMRPTHVYTRGTQTYSIGQASGGAQYGLFHACLGRGRPMDKKNFPGMYSYGKCVVVEYHGDGGAWLNSPDGKFFYIQNAEYMGHRIFDLIDIDTQTLVPNLRVPSVPMRDGMAALGPDPSNGEAGFSNSGDTFLAIVSRVGRSELVIYDRPTPTAWALRRSLPFEATVSGVYPVDKARALLWSRTGSLRLYDIEKNKSLWIANVALLTDDKENTRAKIVIVSPNLQFALFVSDLGSALLDIGSGAVVAKHVASSQQLPSMVCTEKWPDTIANSLPRSPGRCGQVVVRDDGSASVMLQSGATLRLAR